MEVARHVQSTQNRKLVIFLQDIKKIVATASVLYCDAKHSDILCGVSLVRCYYYFLFFISFGTHYTVNFFYISHQFIFVNKTKIFKIGNLSTQKFINFRTF